MGAEIESLVLDLVGWLVEQERTYDEVMYALRSSGCRLAIWEEANRRGLVMIEIVKGHRVAKATSLGLILGELRREARRQVRARPDNAGLSDMVNYSWLSSASLAPETCCDSTAAPGHS
ncbi:MAG: hypothetical protein JO210_09595 [Acidobacteriaceae bacterium]|nr:hypothetical protein [Acidobacteriaceae bacterium]